MNRISKILQPSLVIPKNAIVKNQEITSKSQKVSSAKSHDQFQLNILEIISVDAGSWSDETMCKRNFLHPATPSKVRGKLCKVN